MPLAEFQKGKSMKPRRELTGQRHHSSNLLPFLLSCCAATILALPCPGCGDSPGKPPPGPEAIAGLPEISTFLTQPTDQFLADIREVSRGHPLLGANSPHPHGGGHVHFDNSKKRWPT